MSSKLDMDETDIKSLLIKIGDEIKLTRKASKRKIESISKKTKIRASYLIGIEDGNFEGFNDFIYKKGFIKTYAKFFDLDFSKELDLITRIEEEKNKNQYVSNKETTNSLPSPKYFVVTFISLISIIVGWIEYQKIDEDNSSPVGEDINIINNVEYKLETTDDSNDYYQNDEINSKKFSESKVEKRAFQQIPLDNDNKSIKIIFIDETWIQVYSKDNLIVKSGIYQNGEVIELLINKENSDYLIDTGNAGGFKLQFENKGFLTLGAMGSVKKNISLLDYYEKFNVLE